MFERYTENARRVIFIGRHEAGQLGSSNIETEHLLLGIVRQAPQAIHLLLGKGKTEELRQEIIGSLAKYQPLSTSADLPLSNTCKRVLAYAAEEAERVGDSHIGVEHLLLGLVREKEGFASTVLREHGVTIEGAREKLVPPEERRPGMFYCPKCTRPRNDHLTCGDCSAVICRVCGTPLESPDELGIG